MTLDAWTYKVDNTDLNDFEYAELKDSERESFTQGNATVTKIYQVLWNDRKFFLADLLGYSYVGVSAVKRVLPQLHPEFTNFFAAEAQVEGIGKVYWNYPAYTIGKERANVTVTYRPVDYNVLPDETVTSELQRYCSRQNEFNADYLTLQGGMRFVLTNKLLASTPGQVTGTMGKTITWRQVPANPTNPFVPPNKQKILNCLGRVNDTDFDGDPGQTVLFAGVDTKQVTPRLDGEGLTWEITFKFLIRNNGELITAFYDEFAGHQFIYDVINNRYDLVTADGTAGGARIYKKVDLNTLFTLD